MSTSTPDSVVAQLRWRYATKKFDAARRIDAATWAALEETLVLTPSSYGLQPWTFVVVTDQAVKDRLRAVSWNQGQVSDCSHHVVFAARSEMTESDVDALIDATARARGVAPDSLAGYRGMMIRDVVTGPRSKQAQHWAALQCYIALGNFMTSAAMMGVDTCPMEGIDPAKYDEILGLPATGYRTVVACPAGYRAADDKYASAPKVRFAKDRVVRRV